MRFDYSETESLLQSSVASYLQKNYTDSAVNFCVSSAAGFSSKHWSSFAELGLLGLPFCEDLGGSAGGIFDALAVQMELGRFLVVEPYLTNVHLAGNCVAGSSNRKARDQYIPELISGKSLLAFAHHERGSESTNECVSLSARRGEEAFLLDGEKIAVIGAATARRWVVSCRDQEATLHLLLVNPESAGIVLTEFSTFDGMKSANIVFEAVEVDAASLLASGADAEVLLEDTLISAIALSCAEALGAMEALLARTVDYANNRKQFGKPISQFQVLRHRIADMYMELELSRSMLFATASLIESGACDSEQVALLKTQVSESSRYVAQQAIQIHGGMGMTDELDVGRYFKRLTALDVSYGSAAHHANIAGTRSRPSRAMLDEASKFPMAAET